MIGTVQPKVLSLLFSVKAKPKDVYRYRTDVEQHLNLYGTRAEDSELLLTCFSFGRTQKSFSEPLDVEYEIKIILLLLLVWKKSGQHKMLFSVCDNRSLLLTHSFTHLLTHSLCRYSNTSYRNQIFGVTFRCASTG